MKLEQQVTSLEISKRLKELGVKQESLFRWNESDGVEDRLEYMPEYTDKTHELISAFTVAELGEMLSTVKNNNTIRCTRAITQWGCDYESYRTMGDTEADARGKMLIYLLENNLIEE